MLSLSYFISFQWIKSKPARKTLHDFFTTCFPKVVCTTMAGHGATTY